MMVMDDRTQPTGEERLKTRRNAFVRYTAIGIGIAFVIGFGSGVSMAFVEDGRLPAWSVYLASAVLLGFFAWFTLGYFRRVDELDLLDNLWASTIGFYAYFVTFPVWNTLSQFELAPPVDQLWLWGGSLAVTVIAYCARKLGWR